MKYKTFINMVFRDEDYIIQHGEVPSIQFSDKIKECLYRPWKSAIIIKLMGRPLTFNFLRDRLLRRWQLKGPMTLIDLENNFFIVKFLLEEVMKHVLTGGPWQVVGQYVTTQRWKPGFDPKEEKITHMTAWVRINGLNVEFFRFDVLEKIGNLIGLTVKVDPHTMSQSRGKFARICVELDISKPLTPFIEVEGRTYGVVYEGIQVICFECGHYGHGKIIVRLKKMLKFRQATRADQMPGVAVNAGINVIEENPHNLHDGNRGVASKDANQNSLTGVKKAIHNSAPKRNAGRGKLPLMDCATSPRMTDMNLGNKTMPLNCVGVVGLQVPGSDFQNDVQGVFSFNVGVPPGSLDVLNTVPLIPDHEPPDIESMDVTNEEHTPNVQDCISAEHSQTCEGLVQSGSYLSNDLPNDNDGTVAVQRDKMVKCASTIKDFKKMYAIDVFAVLEPRISGSKALNVATILGFSHYHIVDATGFSGGVWLLWNGSTVSLQVIAHASQSITALVHAQNKCWLLTVVYANPNPRIRESLWTYFDGLAKTSNLPWLVMGDFNDIVCASEKCGGNLDSGGSASVDWIDRNHLIDLGFSGSKFTWCNKRNAEGIIWKRIDRDFATVIRDYWNSCTDHAVQKTANLVSPLIQWNKTIFGCIFQRKRSILARLAGIQKQLCIAPNPFLNQFDLELSDSSSVWRGVLYGSKALNHGIRWRIGSGDDVLFWTDNWLSCGVLRQRATIDLSEELLQTKVSDFLDNGVWDTTCLLACLPDNIVKLITGIHAGFNGSGVDKRIWQFTSDGCFFVKTAYSSLMEDNNLKWKWHFLWKLKIPPKVKTFLWFYAIRRLSQMPIDIKEVSPILKLVQDVPTLRSPLSICLRIAKLSIIFGACLVVMGPISVTLPWHLMTDVRAQIEKTGSIEHTVVYLHWKPPKLGAYKVNTDGSRINATGLSGAGGVLRDSTGGWIQGFAVNLGACHILEAELWGIFWGLSLAWDYGFRDVEIECDSDAAVTLLTSITISTHPLYSIISCCKMKIHDHWCCTIKHIYREQNTVADALATRSYNLDLGLHVYEEAPNFLKDILFVDARGIVRPRSVVL
ncbi:hypothetical protein DKX38_005763 [Salix brachista]|uniref:Uncharacterized protein n=1 Tax=Salix brachista TaxID=2182728 RepID=A0A5N5N3K6_9ROSI|nr:hypothetical protein DKX38_005763 [Salix brachista]